MSRSRSWESDGLYLALETSGALASVALARGADLLAEESLVGSREQSSRILPMIQRVLEHAGVEPRDLDGIVVGAGPGSFTGVRVAAATAKGLVHALGVPLWAVSSLAAAAIATTRSHAVLQARSGTTVHGAIGVASTSAPTSELLRWVLFDARSDRVYAAAYRTVQSGALTEVRAPHPARLGDVLTTASEFDAGVRVFCGDAAVRHEPEIRARGFEVEGPPAGVPTASALLHLMNLDPDRPALTDPFRWEPDYVRSWGGE